MDSAASEVIPAAVLEVLETIRVGVAVSAEHVREDSGVKKTCNYLKGDERWDIDAIDIDAQRAKVNSTIIFLTG